MHNSTDLIFDHLVIGSGLAGLAAAINLSKSGSVAVVTKRKAENSNTNRAQGGIACVIDTDDTFAEHITDTLNAGGDLCDEAIVTRIVEEGPQAIEELIKWGTKFTTRGEMGETQDISSFDLGKEGGHQKRRILHAGDITGEEIQRVLIEACDKIENITIFEDSIAVDIITSKHLGQQGANTALGAYVIDCNTNEVKTFKSYTTTVATGGAGKVYLYSSNPDVACGAGVAMCYRAGLPIANMEYMQFHPTILFHPEVKSFLISEAVRGEGAVLKRKNSRGDFVPFMDSYHEMKSLAPRDIVARAIDNEMKKSGQECVYLDITHKDEEYLLKRFPNIFGKCMEVGLNMSCDMIPVVPAAHYSCGGVVTDINGETEIKGLYAAGETGCTGLHGANRLASNSLLEALVVARLAARKISNRLTEFKSSYPECNITPWSAGDATNSDELVVIAHNWDEIRRFMWDYVGIVRTTKRLERAKARIQNIRHEINKYYWDFLITPDLVELRNISSVAEIIIDSAMRRHESRGLHYNTDFPERRPELDGVNTIIRKLTSDSIQI